MLKNNSEVQRLLDKDCLKFGTLDTWLVHKLTGGKVSFSIFYKLVNYLTKNYSADLGHTMVVGISFCFLQLLSQNNRAFALYLHFANPWHYFETIDYENWYPDKN